MALGKTFDSFVKKYFCTNLNSLMLTTQLYFYFRYIDYCFCLFNDTYVEASDFLNFVDTLNHVSVLLSKLKVTINSFFDLLNLRELLSSLVYFKVYRKPTTIAIFHKQINGEITPASINCDVIYISQCGHKLEFRINELFSYIRKFKNTD